MFLVCFKSNQSCLAPLRCLTLQTLLESFRLLLIPWSSTEKNIEPPRDPPHPAFGAFMAGGHLTLCISGFKALFELAGSRRGRRERVKWEAGKPEVRLVFEGRRSLFKRLEEVDQVSVVFKSRHS